MPPPEDPDSWLTPLQAAHLLDLGSARTVVQLVDAGDLAAERINQRLRIRRADVDAYLEARPQPVKPRPPIARPRPEPEPVDELLHPAKAAVYLGITQETLRRWCRDGRLAWRDIHGQPDPEPFDGYWHRFSTQDLDAFIDAQRI